MINNEWENLNYLDLTFFRYGDRMLYFGIEEDLNIEVDYNLSKDKLGMTFEEFEKWCITTYVDGVFLHNLHLSPLLFKYIN